MKLTPTKVVQALFLLYLIYLGYKAFSNPDNWSFLDGVNLIIHEAGHVLFIPFGQFIYFLGGSFWQVAIPAIFAYSFWRQLQPYATGFALFWTGQSLLNVSRYVKDARAMNLELISDDSTHDWNWILGQLHLLPYDHLFGNILWVIALALVVWGVIHMGRQIVIESSPYQTIPPPPGGAQ